MQIKTVLANSITRLNSNEAFIEAHLLLQSVLEVNRAWLISHADDDINPQSITTFNILIERRILGEPIAYILGEREFYGLPLKVTQDTLIPRPDTETLVEVVLDKAPSFSPLQVLDLGTGTGAIALTIAKLQPQAQVIAVDFSEAALTIAKENAHHLDINNVSFIQSNWFDALESQMFDIIVSNPPYIEDNDPHLSQGDLRFEPLSALASGEDGLDDIRKIIQHAPAHLNSNGWLMFEHGYNQAESVSALLASNDFTKVSTIKDLGGNDRVTVGRKG